MSRPFLRRFRLFARGARIRSGDSDRILVDLCRELTATVHALQVLLEDDGRDTDEIPGFDELADREHAFAARIIAVPATSFPGLLAKAHAARLRPEISGYDGAAALALSLADDLLRFAAADPAADPLLPGPGRPAFRQRLTARKNKT